MDDSSSFFADSPNFNLSRLETRVYDTDIVEDIAKKIFYKFEVNQSCAVTGLDFDEQTRRPLARGELVLSELKRLDRLENYSGSGARKSKKIPDSIGGPLAQKIFRFKKVIVDEVPKFTFWRVQ